MIRLLLIFTIFSMLFSCQSDEIKEIKEIKKQKVIVSSLIVRESPNKNSKQISKIESGKVITTIARSLYKDTIQIKGFNEEAYWYKLTDNGKTGWVFGGCLSDEFPRTDREKIDIGAVKSGQIWACNDTFLNCKVNQKDQETEIYVYNIAFIDHETAIIHDFSSAGHTDETIEKVKYKIEDNLLKIFIPDKFLSRETLIDITDWKIEKREPWISEYELEKCGDKHIFRVVGGGFYCGRDTELDYQESFTDIDSLINTPSVKRLLKTIK